MPLIGRSLRRRGSKGSGVNIHCAGRRDWREAGRGRLTLATVDCSLAASRLPPWLIGGGGAGGAAAAGGAGGFCGGGTAGRAGGGGSAAADAAGGGGAGTAAAGGAGGFCAGGTAAGTAEPAGVVLPVTSRLGSRRGLIAGGCRRRSGLGAGACGGGGAAAVGLFFLCRGLSAGVGFGTLIGPLDRGRIVFGLLAGAPIHVFLRKRNATGRSM